MWQAEVDVQHAALALVRGERSGALATVRALLAGPHAAGLQTTDRVECWRVLAANQAPEADGWRQSTRALLMANALRIPNMATREAYLTRIPEHRELMAAAPRGPAAAVGG